MWFHRRRSAGSRHCLRSFLTNHVVPVWFHVVPTAAKASAAKPFTYEPRGSCVVPCGSMWFHRRLSAGSRHSPRSWRRLLPPSRSHASPVVHVWFRVVPCGSIGAAAQEAAIPCDAALQFTWFLCGSMWFLQRQSLLLPSRSNGIWRGRAENMWPQTPECMRLHHQGPPKKLFLK